jgi:sugar (pentulose or hexulose) kinase
VILAGQSVGGFADAAAGAQRLVRFDRVFEPDHERHAEYARLRSRYEDLLAAIRPTFGA